MVNHVTKKPVLLTRGKLAKQLAIHPETIRFYETQKILKKPSRLINNYRIYDEEDVERIKFVLMAKELGFSIKEIKELLSLSVNEKTNRDKVRQLTENKINLIQEKIRQLNHIAEELSHLIKLCKTKKKTAICPILNSVRRK